MIWTCSASFHMAERSGRRLPGHVPVPLPSPSSSPPPLDRQTQFAIANSLWLDVTSASFTSASNPSAIVEKVKETGRIFEKAVMASGAADFEKAALCSMWQHYDHCFSDVLRSLLNQVKLNKKLIAVRQKEQLHSTSRSEFPPLQSSDSPIRSAPKIPELSVKSPAASAPLPAAGRVKSHSYEETIMQLETRLRREQEEREAEVEKLKRKMEMLESDKRHLKIEVANLEQVINAQLHIAKNESESDVHIKRSDYNELPVDELLSIHKKSLEVEHFMLDVERGFSEGEDLLLRLNFMMRKLRTDETLRAGGQDLEGFSLDIINVKLKADLTVARRQLAALQQQNQEAKDRIQSLEKILHNRKTELVQLVSQLNGVSAEEAEEMLRSKGNGALTDGIAKQNQNQTKVYEGKSIRVQPMPSGRWPSEIAVTIERFGIDVALHKYGSPSIDKFFTMSFLPQNVPWDEEDMPMGHSLLRALVACAQGQMPLMLKQLSAQLQSIVAKLHTAAEKAVVQRVADAGDARQEEKGWGKKGSVGVIGAISKLKRRVGVFRNSHETADERKAESLKFVANALDPKASVPVAQLLHEVSVVMNLKMRVDEEHSILLQQQLVESRMTGALSPFLCPILQAAPPSLAAVCTMYYTSVVGRRNEAVACVKALADCTRSHRGSHWRLYFYSILTSMDAQSVKSHHVVTEAERKGTSARALASGSGKSSSSKRCDSIPSASGAAAAASPTTSTLQFFSYILRLLTSGEGFKFVSEAARARKSPSREDKCQVTNTDESDQYVEMQALKELLERDLFLAENIGETDSSCFEQLQRQLLAESSHVDSSASTRVPLDDVLRCMLDRYMAHQARLASLIKATFKQAAEQHSGACTEYEDVISSIYCNRPMESITSALRMASMPKFPLFNAVISSVIPSLGDARIMQLYDIMSLLYEAWPDRSADECFAEAARYCGIVHAFLLQAAHDEAKVSQ